MAAWYAVFAAYAGLIALFTPHADQAWGLWAVGGYLLAAITAVLCRRARGRDAALVVGAAGALVGPLTWLAVRRPATADVDVVARAAVLLLRHGSPYLASAQLSAWRSYDPYLPAMSVFGMFHAAGIPGMAGEPRVWLAVATVALLAAAFGLVAPHRMRQCSGCRHEALRRAVFAVSTPLLALPLALGITDPPVLALFCVALACLAAGPVGSATARAAVRRWPARLRLPRLRPSRLTVAGLAIGFACAMKITAWPAVPVIFVMIAARDGMRTAWRFVAICVVTAATAIVATAPAALTKPAVFVQNTVLFPLGLARHATPAASPLPGHLIAATGAAGHWAAISLLLLAGLAMTVWLLVRRPAGSRAAAWRLAVGLAVMFALAPATRWGYFAYPLGLLGWLGLAGRDRAAAYESPQPQEVAGPAPAGLTSAMAGLNGSSAAVGPAEATAPSGSVS
jgi:phosphatidylinositol alpha-1,6-mannosyltransferase